MKYANRTITFIFDVDLNDENWQQYVKFTMEPLYFYYYHILLTNGYNLNQVKLETASIELKYNGPGLQLPLFFYLI